MNGPHDMGGFDRFGPINPEQDEPVFHSPWEARAFALQFATSMTGSWNIDIGRHARERLPPITYWSSSYYEYRHYAMVNLLVELGMVTPDEVKSGKSAVPPKPVKRVASPGMILDYLPKGSPATRPSSNRQGLQAGNMVRARNITPLGHTRLPRYARGRVGEIVAIHGTHVLPDSSAHGLGDNAQWLYTVRFTAKELWGKDNDDAVNIDLWESYLEAL